jgi:uncharacterized DUF497 family protein
MTRGHQKRRQPPSDGAGRARKKNSHAVNPFCTLLNIRDLFILLVNSIMTNEFEWDPEKAARNLTEHGVAFETASEVFRDPFAVEWLDDREDYSEVRFVIVGMVDDRLLYVAYTMRGEVIRIISARGAEPHERRRYHEEDD